MDNKKKLIVFCTFFVLALAVWRLRVFFYYNNGGLPLARAATGLNLHHYHYGILLVLITALMLIFYKPNFYSIGIMGFGLGSIFDSVISGLIKPNTVRTVEIARYNSGFLLTLLLFGIVVILSVIFYLSSKNIKINDY